MVLLMKRIWKLNFTMNRKIFCLSSSILLISLLITGISVHNHFRQLYAESLDNAIQVIIENHSSSIEDCFRRAETIANLLNADLPLLIPQLEESTDIYDKYWTYLDLEAKLKSFCDSALGTGINYKCLLLLRSEFPTASLISAPSDNLFTFTPRNNTSIRIIQDKFYKDQEWFQLTNSLQDSSYWFSHPDNSHYIWMTRNLNDYFVITEQIQHYSLGMLVIGIDISWFTEYLDDNALVSNLDFLITDSLQRIIYAEDSSLLNLNFCDLIEEKNYFTSENSSNLTVTMNGKKYRLWAQLLPNNMHLLSFIPEQTLNSQLWDNLYLFVILFLIVLLAGIILTAFFARIVTLPIRKLSTHMRHITVPTTIKHNYKTTDEMGILYHTFNEMTENHNQLIQQIYDYAEQQKQLQYTLLQAQISPHFLYNTLDSVSCAAMLNNDTQLSDTLSSLAQLLRYNINNPEKLVTLKDELDMVNDYIRIQQFRYDNQIRYTCRFEQDVPSDIACARLPKTVLQPLIENSIQYGSCNADGYRYISVEICFQTAQTAKKTENNVSIIICNEYHNLETSIEEYSHFLNQYLSGKCELQRKNSGLGIRNVLQRIQMVFGGKYGIHYEHHEKKLAVVIKLPFIT